MLAFESAARHASFTLAAQELRISQAAVSRQIARLETWLSACLFERSRAGVTLTEAGRRFRDGLAAGLAAIGWATWDDWFGVAGRPDRAPRRVGFDCYTYVLEPAAAGQGLALGWRYLIERSLESGALVALGDGFVEFDNYYVGVLTEKGRRKPLARRCLAFFDRLR